MIKKVAFIVVFFIFLFIGTLFAGQYYKYIDESGKLRFTDDISKVPQDQREAVETFKAKNYKKPVNETSQDSENSRTTENSSEIKYTNKEIAPDTFQAQAVELDSMQKKLREIRESLEQERLALEESMPKEGSTTNQKITYSTKVEALNERIAQYEKELKKFNDKVDEFNASRKKAND